MPASAFDKRYKLLSVIGAGSMGVVHRAFDRLTGDTIAIKQVSARATQRPGSTPAEAETARLALAREFQALASLRHPNIIAVRDYGFITASQPYITMDLLEGAQTILEAGRAASLDQQVDLLLQLLHALAYLHRRNILHRDLKPANVMVTGRRLKVLDFGLSVHVAQAAGQTSGTLAYMPPEVLSGSPAAVASDLYAVGIMAYELFTGRHPFGSTNLSALIDAILAHPPDLAGLNPRLAPLITRLTAKDPAARFGSAQDVIASMSATVGRPLQTETSEARDSFLQAASLVGRDMEVARLREAFNVALHGSASAWLIGGESGIGKSRLLDEIRTLALVGGALVVRGQTTSTGGRAYGLWGPAARWLALLTDPDDRQASVLKFIVPDIARLVGRPVPEAVELPALEAEDRLLTVLAELLRRAAAQQPLVIMLEDLHWAGDNSLGLLARLIRTLLRERLPVLILGSYRDDEAPGLAARLPEASALPLARLSPAAIADLSESMLGPAGSSPQVVSLLQHETEGNAFFAVEIVRALAEEAGSLDRIAGITLPVDLRGGGMQRLVQRRLNHLAPADRQVIDLAAVLGRRLDLALLRHAFPAVDLDSTLLHCADAAVLDVRDNAWVFTHDKLREAVLAQYDPTDEGWRALHRLAAQTVETVYGGAPAHVASLAHHWQQAGDLEKAAHYAELAGTDSAARYANDDAVRYFTQALAFPIDARRRIGLLRRLGRVLDHVGNWSAAEGRLREGLGLAVQLDDHAIQAEFQSALGALFARRGLSREAHTWLEAARSRFEALGDQRGLGHTLYAMGIAADEAGFQQALAYLHRAAEILERLSELRTVARCHCTLGITYLHLGDHASARQHVERGLRLAASANDRAVMSQACMTLGLVASQQGDQVAAMNWYQRELDLALESGARRQIAMAVQTMGSLYEARGDRARAAACMRYWLATAADMEDHWSVGLAVSVVGQHYSQEGAHAEALALYPRAVAVLRSLHQPYWLCLGLHRFAEALLAAGRLEEAQAVGREAHDLARQANRRDVLFSAMQFEIQVRLAQGALSPIDACAGLNTIEALSDSELAALLYARWRLAPEPAVREQAADLYRGLYRQTPAFEFGRRYADLTGERLPEPEALPELPRLVAEARVDMAGVLAQVDSIIERLPGD